MSEHEGDGEVILTYDSDSDSLQVDDALFLQGPHSALALRVTSSIVIPGGYREVRAEIVP